MSTHTSLDENKSMHLEGRRSVIYALKNVPDHLLVFFMVQYPHGQRFTDEIL